MTPKRLLSRVLTFPAIRPILDEAWHSPMAHVAGAEQPVSLPVQKAYPPATFREARLYAQHHKSSALLVMQKGQLIFEEYYRGFQPEQGFNSMSMMKTVVSLLIGIAIDEGAIDSIDTPACEFITEWQHDARREITIKHLLTMQSGLMSDVALGKYFNRVIPLYLGDDVAKYAIECPAYSKPGTKLVYNNVNSQILGIILERATQRRYVDYLSEKLWQPLGCHDAKVWVDDKGMARTFSALFARPQDWLKLGQLVLNDGVYQEQQLVSQAWVQAMKVGYDADARYGLHIWTKAHTFDFCAGFPKFEYYPSAVPYDDEKTVFFEGMRVQLLAVVPSKDLLVFRMGEAPRRDWDAVTMVHHVTRHLPN